MHRELRLLLPTPTGKPWIDPEGIPGGLSAGTEISGQKIILALPISYMNLSGLAVRALLKKHRMEAEDLLVVCDDLDLELGRMKLKTEGSSGGHHGIQSIIDTLLTRQFCRLRVGIGRPPDNIDPVDYVLGCFKKGEKAQVGEAVEKAVDCCLFWINHGMQKSMNIFNRKGVN